MSLSDDLALAHRIADAVAPISMRHFERGVTASPKPDGSPVTVADHAVEDAILAVLARERPLDGVLSEEAGGSGRTDRRWIVDPIDGTRSFVAGSSAWATLLALEVEGEIVLGLVDCPAMARRYWATRGGEAFSARTVGTRLADQQSLSVSAITTLSSARFSANAVVLANDSRNATLLAAQSTWTEKTTHYVLDLVEGRVDVVLLEDYGDSWDHAAWVVIAEEAGGVFFDLDGGRSIETRHAVYTTSHLEAAVRAVLDLPR
ncbi:MAG: histidinol-phosphatase [Actinomycetota bacterium]|jgi:histidinol-phosphatase